MHMHVTGARMNGSDRWSVYGAWSLVRRVVRTGRRESGALIPRSDGSRRENVRSLLPACMQHAPGFHHIDGVHHTELPRRRNKELDPAGLSARLVTIHRPAAHAD
jgi:hypothetical protein